MKNSLLINRKSAFNTKGSSFMILNNVNLKRLPLLVIMILALNVNGQVSKENSSVANRIPPPDSPFTSAYRAGNNSDAPAGSISVAENATYNAYSAEQLVQNVLVTGCLTASNVRFGYYNRNNNNTWVNHTWSGTPGNRQLAYFSKGTSSFPLEEGLLLCTGNASSAMGPNNNTGKSDKKVSNASDPDLATITGRTMYDAAVLEFDFVPAGDSIEFTFVFTSEEYLEYVGSQYNDAFGFFLSGPGISGPYTNNAVNLATIPGTTTPVSINTIHPAVTNNYGTFPATNETYYFSNASGSLTMQYDGGTVVLKATYAVQPCSTYRIRMSIADASDQEWDAGVFLGAKSFNSQNISLTNYALNNYGSFNEGQNNIFEGCNDYLRIERSGSDISAPLTVNLNISGTATNGTDILTSDNQPFPTQITFPANVAYIDIPYSAVSDGISDNDETFIVKAPVSCPCESNQIYVTQTIHLYELANITSVSALNLQCFGQSNGTITVNVSGGSGSYQYSINNGSTWQNINTFTGLSAGTYTILVRDPGSCYPNVTATATIGSPTAIVAQAGQDVSICNGESTQLNGTGGVLYSWSPSTGLNYTNIANPIATPSVTTTYTLTVTNASGNCSSTDQVVITVNPVPEFTTSVTDVTCYAGNNGSIAVTPGSGAISDFQYSKDDGATYQNSNIFNGLVAGTYFIKVKNISGGCESDHEYVIINEPSVLTAGESHTAIACNGGNSTVTISATGGAAPYTGTGDFTQAAGTHTYTVTDANGCSDDVTVTISQPEILVAGESHTAIACNGGNSTVTISATGGAAPYTGTGDFTQAAGTHTYTVTDANGCSDDITVTITEPDAIIAYETHTPILCNGGSSTVTITATGGTPPYSGTGEFIQYAGEHMYYVVDANGCYKKIDVALTEPTKVIPAITAQNITCAGQSTGSITATGTGGTGPYTYTLTEIAGTACAAVEETWHSGMNADLTAPAGMIFINVDFASFGLPEGACPDFTYGTCHAANSQAIAESYLIGNNSASIPATTDLFGDPCSGEIKRLYIKATYADVIGTSNQTGIFNNLPAGNYLVLVHDANGCVGKASTTLTDTTDTEAPVWITLPGALDATLSCDDATGLATAMNMAPVAQDDYDASLTYQKTTGTLVTGTCPQAGTITNTWVAIDDCGNISPVYTQIISIIDSTSPTFTGPANITIYKDALCNYNADPSITGLPANIHDNCDPDPVASYTDGACFDNSTTQSMNAGRGYYYPIQISGYDGISASQLEKFEMQFYTNKGKGNVEFLLIAPSGDGIILVGPYCSGGYCDNNAAATYRPSFYPAFSGHPQWANSNNIPTGTGNYTPFGATSTANTSTITGFNGNFRTKFEDLTGPMNGEWILYGKKQGTGLGVVTFEGACLTPVGCENSELIVRKWTVTDHCGNASTTFNQVINIQDSTAPVLTIPADVTVECNEVPVVGVVSATDNCDTAVAITYLGESRINGICNNTYLLKRSWKAVDNCGNESTAIQTITVQDTTAPSITVQASNLTVDCDGAGNAAQLTAWLASNGGALANDLCSNVTWSNNFEALSDLCGNTGAATVTFTATDDCGNFATTTATFTIQDTTKPAITCPENIIVNNDPGLCSATVTVPVPAVVEACSSVTLVNSFNQSSNASGVYPVGTTTILWIATDECGNADSCSMTVTVVDNEQPVITCPADLVLCDTEPVVLGQATATDNCDPNPVITNNAPAVFPVGVTYVTWIAIDIHNNADTCIQSVTIIAHPTANAGPDQTICQADNFTVTGASATNYASVLWTHSGQGSLLNANTLTPTYVPQVGETGNIYLTLTAYANTPCADSSDQMLLSILPQPVATAGENSTICSDQTFVPVTAYASNYNSILWTTSGTGTFDNPGVIHPVYTPSQADLAAGSVILTLTAFGSTPCGDISDPMTLTFATAPAANAGPDDISCAAAPYTLSGSAAAGESLLWTSAGTGTFDNATILHATYTPSTADIAAGSVVLTLHAYGIALCESAADDMTLTILPATSAFAGEGATICNSTPFTIGDATASGYTSILWTHNGQGTLTGETTLTPTYTPAVDETGNVTLTLTVTGTAPCGDATDEAVLTIQPIVAATAGPDLYTCETAPIAISQASAQNFSAIAWTTSGTGTFDDAALLNPVYTPSAADMQAGTVILTMNVTGLAPCGDIQDNLTLTINLAPVAGAGPDASTCQSIPFTVSGASASNYSSILWSSNGTGTLTGETTLTPTYTPAAGESGTIILTLTVNGPAACGNVVATDQLSLIVYESVIANAGLDQSIPANTATALDGSASGGSGMYTWSWQPESLLSDASVANPSTLPLAQPTTFTLTVLDLASGCYSSDEVTVSVFLNSNNPPVAIDDYDTTSMEQPVTISILDNDYDPDGDPITVSLLTYPHNGTIILNANQTVTYTPAANFFGIDTCTYVICDNGQPSLCDTATIFITVLGTRENLIFYNGISPNRDGLNDVWIIGNIEFFPENKVIIFNRWGDIVYSVANYDNKNVVWDGTYEKSGNHVPDGTYFYIVTVPGLGKYDGWILVRGSKESE